MNFTFKLKNAKHMSTILDEELKKITFYLINDESFVANWAGVKIEDRTPGALSYMSVNRSNVNVN